MPKEAKVAFLEQLEKRFGKIEKLPNSLSLYDVGKGAGTNLCSLLKASSTKPSILWTASKRFAAA
jgi:hypothetical protein